MSEIHELTKGTGGDCLGCGRTCYSWYCSSCKYRLARAKEKEVEERRKKRRVVKIKK